MNEQINKLREQTDWKPWHFISDRAAIRTSIMTTESLQGYVIAAEETTQIIYDLMGKA